MKIKEKKMSENCQCCRIEKTNERSFFSYERVLHYLTHNTTQHTDRSIEMEKQQRIKPEKGKKKKKKNKKMSSITIFSN